MDVGYYASAARTTLNMLCSSRSSTEIELTLANPRVLTTTFGAPNRAPAKVPKVQPSDPDNVPVKTVQIGADSSRITRIAGNLEEK